MRRSLLLLALPLLLTACGNDRPVYFGHQGSTEGMPGYVNGEKTNPNIKLGKPYKVGGRVYVPTYDPNYVEEGMASWYGPGFHGGKTANGERFDKYDFTAAHTTLPLPSIVKVTNLKNDKFVYVRVNDRGPYADGRIIDLSKAAAEQIDLVRAGTAKVRVEYMKDATDKLVSMMNQGRDPSTIDIAHEVITGQPVQVAQGRPSWWDYVNPVPSARAAELPASAAVVENVESTDVAPPALTEPEEGQSPFEPVTEAPTTTTTTPLPLTQDQEVPPSVKAMPVTTARPTQQLPAYYVQLGSFSVKSNAEAMQIRVAGPVTIEPVTGPSGAQLYRVRMGPFTSAQEAEAAIANARQSGVGDARVIKP